MKDPETRRERTTFRLPFLMAHELMDYLYAPWGQVIAEIALSNDVIKLLMQYLWTQASGKLVRDRGAIDEFWRHCQARMPWATDHPGVGKSPISVYGDEARYNDAGDKILLLTISPILRPNNARDLPSF